jgi:hypothetical protein
LVDTFDSSANVNSDEPLSMNTHSNIVGVRLKDNVFLAQPTQAALLRALHGKEIFTTATYVDALVDQLGDAGVARKFTNILLSGRIRLERGALHRAFIVAAEIAGLTVDQAFPQFQKMLSFTRQAADLPRIRLKSTDKPTRGQSQAQTQLAPKREKASPPLADHEFFEGRETLRKRLIAQGLTTERLLVDALYPIDPARRGVTENTRWNFRTFLKSWTVLRKDLGGPSGYLKHAEVIAAKAKLQLAEAYPAEATQLDARNAAIRDVALRPARLPQRKEPQVKLRHRLPKPSLSEDAKKNQMRLDREIEARELRASPYANTNLDFLLTAFEVREPPLTTIGHLVQELNTLRSGHFVPELLHFLSGRVPFLDPTQAVAIFFPMAETLASIASISPIDAYRTALEQRAIFIEDDGRLRIEQAPSISPPPAPPVNLRGIRPAPASSTSEGSSRIPSSGFAALIATHAKSLLRQTGSPQDNVAITGDQFQALIRDRLQHGNFAHRNDVAKRYRSLFVGTGTVSENGALTRDAIGVMRVLGIDSGLVDPRTGLPVAELGTNVPLGAEGTPNDLDFDTQAARTASRSFGELVHAFSLIRLREQKKHPQIAEISGNEFDWLVTSLLPHSMSLERRITMASIYRPFFDGVAIVAADQEMISDASDLIKLLGVPAGLVNPRTGASTLDGDALLSVIEAEPLLATIAIHSPSSINVLSDGSPLSPSPREIADDMRAAIEQDAEDNDPRSASDTGLATLISGSPPPPSDVARQGRTRAADAPPVTNRNFRQKSAELTSSRRTGSLVDIRLADMADLVKNYPQLVTALAAQDIFTGDDYVGRLMTTENFNRAHARLDLRKLRTGQILAFKAAKATFSSTAERAAKLVNGALQEIFPREFRRTTTQLVEPERLSDLSGFGLNCPDLLRVLEVLNIRTDHEFRAKLEEGGLSAQRANIVFRQLRVAAVLVSGVEGTMFTGMAREIARALDLAPEEAFPDHAKLIGPPALAKPSGSSRNADFVDGATAPTQSPARSSQIGTALGAGNDVGNGSRAGHNGMGAVRSMPRVVLPKVPAPRLPTPDELKKNADRAAARQAAVEVAVRRLDHEPYAREHLQPLLKALAALDPPVETFPDLARRMGDVGEGAMFERGRRILTGGARIYIALDGGTRFGLTPAALALVVAASSTSGHVYANVLGNGTYAQARKTGAATSVSATSIDEANISWSDFAKIYATLAEALEQEKGIRSLDEIFQFIRPLWPDQSTVRTAMAELISSGQPIDPYTCRLKPLPSTIAMTLNPAVPTMQYFGAYRETMEGFERLARERHVKFVELVAKQYVARNDAKSTDRGPSIMPGCNSDNPAKVVVAVPEDFVAFLTSKTPGRWVQKSPIISTYRRLIEGQVPLVRKGTLVPEAEKILEIMGVPRATINEFVTPLNGKNPHLTPVREQDLGPRPPSVGRANAPNFRAPDLYSA